MYREIARGHEHVCRLLLVGGCGYVGSYLYPRLVASGFEVVICDLGERGNPLGVPVVVEDYARLSTAFLHQFDAVLWFAGHSSVARAMHDPDGAMASNCLNLLAFGQVLRPTTKFIYASSACLYSCCVPTATASSEASPVGPSLNAYDQSKYAFDRLAQRYLPNAYGLRLGSVAGFSPNLRDDLVFNAMNISALRSGEVRLRNRHAMRTLLFLDDLWHLVKALLTRAHPPGIYNAGSVSTSLQALAHAVAACWRARIVDEGMSRTYSYHMTMEKMSSVCDNASIQPDLAVRCRQFAEELSTEGMQAWRVA